MNNRQRRTLKQRYLTLVRLYDARLAQYSCGRELAEHIDPALSEWRHQIDAIVGKVEAAIAEAKKGE